MARKTLDEILGGVKQFGQLSIIGEAEPLGKNRRAECRCVCGNVRQVLTFSLTSGSTISCGCVARARAAGRAAKMGRANKQHGKHGSPEYRAWRAAIDRCERKSNSAYKNYGARGITVSDEWRQSFEAFFRDMGPRPSHRHTLERKDNSLGYSMDNCEWRVWEAQNRNRRNTVIVQWRGRAVPLAKLAARCGADYGNLYRRIFRLGWDVERALKQPLRQVAK